jgi:hypothetical protein
MKPQCCRQFTGDLVASFIGACLRAPTFPTFCLEPGVERNI